MRARVIKRTTISLAYRVCEHTHAHTHSHSAFITFTSNMLFSCFVCVCVCVFIFHEYLIMVVVAFAHTLCALYQAKWVNSVVCVWHCINVYFVCLFLLLSLLLLLLDGIGHRIDSQTMVIRMRLWNWNKQFGFHFNFHFHFDKYGLKEIYYMLEIKCLHFSYLRMLLIKFHLTQKQTLLHGERECVLKLLKVFVLIREQWICSTQYKEDEEKTKFVRMIMT